MLTPRKLALVLGVTALAIAFSISAPRPASAEQEVTCWWCGWMNFTDGPWHSFFQGGEGCGWPKPSTMYSNVECSRCGGTSACHVDDPQPGECHIQCGGQAAAKVGEELEEALDRNDLPGIRKLLADLEPGLRFRYDPTDARVLLFAECDDSRPVSAHAVSPRIRASLAELMAE
jgi:hypothetical protein